MWTRRLPKSRHVTNWNAKLRRFGTKRESLQTNVARVDALDRARQMVGATLIRYDALAQDREQLVALQTEHDDIQKAVSEQLPALEARQIDIRRLGVQASRLTRIEAVRGNATLDLQRAQTLHQELDGHLERGNTLNQEIKQSESRVAELDEKIHAYDVGDAYGEWATALQETNAPDDSENALTLRRSERDALNAEQRQYLIRLGAVVIGIALVSALLLPALVISTNNLFLGVFVALVLAALATIAVVLLVGRLLNANRSVARVNEEWAAEGEMSARHTLKTSAQTRVDAAVARLKTLNVEAPATVGAAQSQTRGNCCHA